MCLNSRETQKRLWAERALVEEVAREGGHVDPVTLSRYLDDDLPAHVRLLADIHLAACAPCRGRRQAMRAGRARAAAQPASAFAYQPAAPAPPRQGRFSAPLGYASAAAAVAAGVLYFHLLAWNPEPSRGPLRAPQPAVAPRRLAGQGRDDPSHTAAGKRSPGERRPRPRMAHNPLRARGEPAAGSPRIAEPPRGAARPAPPPGRRILVALAADVRLEGGVAYEGDTRLPAWSRDYLEPLREEPPRYRDAALPPSPPIELTQPDPGDRAVRGTRPVFAWEPVDDASGYDVRLEVATGDFGETFEELPDALLVEGATARPKPEVSLDPGRRYRLRIRPAVPEEEAPLTLSPREAVYQFEVLSGEQRRHAGWADANAGRAPIASAMVLYRLGLYAQSEKITGRWPAGLKTRRWAQAIRESRDRRRSDPSTLR